MQGLQPWEQDNHISRLSLLLPIHTPEEYEPVMNPLTEV